MAQKVDTAEEDKPVKGLMSKRVRDFFNPLNVDIDNTEEE